MTLDGLQIQLKTYKSNKVLLLSVVMQWKLAVSSYIEVVLTKLEAQWSKNSSAVYQGSMNLNGDFVLCEKKATMPQLYIS